MLTLNPEIEANLVKLAQSRGVSVDALLQSMVTHELEIVGTGPNGEGKAHAFIAWADSFPDEAPVLSDEDISRENLYPDRY